LRQQVLEDLRADTGYQERGSFGIGLLITAHERFEICRRKRWLARGIFTHGQRLLKVFGTTHVKVTKRNSLSPTYRKCFPEFQEAKDNFRGRQCRVQESIAD
jgi:hypothetical protein